MGCKNRHIQNGQLMGDGANDGGMGAINGKVGQFMGNGVKWGRYLSNGAFMGEWGN